MSYQRSELCMFWYCTFVISCWVLHSHWMISRKSTTDVWYIAVKCPIQSWLVTYIIWCLPIYIVSNRNGFWEGWVIIWCVVKIVTATCFYCPDTFSFAHWIAAALQYNWTLRLVWSVGQLCLSWFYVVCEQYLLPCTQIVWSQAVQ